MSVALLRESYRLVLSNSYVSCSYLIEPMFLRSSMYRFISPLIVLVPQDLNLPDYD